MGSFTSCVHSKGYVDFLDEQDQIVEENQLVLDIRYFQQDVINRNENKRKCIANAIKFKKAGRNFDALREMKTAKRIEYGLKLIEQVLSRLENAASVITLRKDHEVLKVALQHATTIMSRFNLGPEGDADEKNSIFETNKEFDLMMKNLQKELDVIDKGGEMISLDGTSATDSDLMSELEKYENGTLELPVAVPPTIRAAMGIPVSSSSISPSHTTYPLHVESPHYPYLPSFTPGRDPVVSPHYTIPDDVIVIVDDKES